MKVNWNRVVLGGLLAGLVVNLSETVVNGLLLSSDWEAAMKSLNRTAQLGTFANLSFWIWGFLIGIWILWLYAVIRPHYGPGPKTAAIAGSAVWVPGSLLAWIAPAALGLFEYRLILIGVVAGLVEFVAGAVAGAWLYQDQEASEANKAGSGR